VTPVRRPLVRALTALLAGGVLALPAAAQEARPATPPKAQAQPPAKGQAPAKAQTQTQTQTRTQAQAQSGKPAAGQAKSATGQTIRTPQDRRRAAGVPEPTSAEEMAALPPADEAQKAASELVHYGKYVCDDKFEVFVERNRIVGGYVDVRYKRDVWVMKPVASNSGAVRLEDIRGKVLLVQIPFKSMLLNTQTGQRIVDSCQHDVQIDAQKEAAAAPNTDTPMLK
jgi:hypothetical protein